jgi:hypothetical protein
VTPTAAAVADACLSTSPSQLLNNPSFECGESSWKKWNEVLFRSSIDTDRAFEGNGFVRMFQVEYKPALEYTINLTAGQQYELEFVWRTLNTGEGKCDVNIWYINDVVLSLTLPQFQPYWQRYSSTFTAPANEGQGSLFWDYVCEDDEDFALLDLDAMRLTPVGSHQGL